MKTKLAIILSILSFVGVLVVIGIWLFNGWKLSIVSLDTFIGVTIAMLAIVFTVIVGWEIIKAIEVKERMSKLEQRQNAILEIERGIVNNQQNYTKIANNLQAGLSSASADLYVLKGQYIEAFGCCHSALHNEILADTPNQLNRINQLRLLIQMITTWPMSDSTLIFKQIVSESEEIRKTTSYRNCLSEIYEQTMSDFWQKMQLLGLKCPENVLIEKPTGNSLQ